MSVSKQTSTAIMMNTNNVTNDIDRNRILANNKAKRAKIASEHAMNNSNHKTTTSNLSNTTNNANQQRRARFLNSNSNNNNNSNDEMDEDSMGSTVMQPPLPPSTYPTTGGGIAPAPSKRTTSLPPGAQQPANGVGNGGKNVVYLNLKNRAIKSDSAYSVSQLIKVNAHTSVINSFGIFIFICIYILLNILLLYFGK